MPAGGSLRVKALQPSRWRAGFAFTPAERELDLEALGDGVDGLARLRAICADPCLKVVLVNGDQELPVGPAVLADIEALLASEQLRVDAQNPPAVVAGLTGPGDEDRPGETSEPGETGETGETGEPGEPGEPGETGETARPRRAKAKS